MGLRFGRLTARRTTFNPVFVHVNYRLIFCTLPPSLPILLEHISGGDITHVTINNKTKQGERRTLGVMQVCQTTGKGESSLDGRI